LTSDNTDLADLVEDWLVLRIRRREPHHEVGVCPELVCGFEAFVPGQPLDLWRRCGSRLTEERTERFQLVLALDVLHILHVGRIDQLRSGQRPEELRVTPHNPLDTSGKVAPPCWRGQQDRHTIVAILNRPGVVEYKAPQVVPLTRVEPSRIDPRHRQHPRLSPHIHPCIRVRRVVVWRNDVGVLRC
jgi:hypothetical protein